MGKTLYLMVGYPGAGKTTIATFIHEITGAEHVWADHYRREWFGNPTHQPDETKMLYDRLNDMVEYTLKKGKSVVFDTNFNYYRDRRRMATMAKTAGAKTVVVWVQTKKDIAKDRAVDNAHEHKTRILGHMPLEAFERLSSNLEEPHKQEYTLIVDGTNATKAYVAERLKSLS